MLVTVGRDLSSRINYSEDGGLTWFTAAAAPRQRTCVAYGAGVFVAMSPSRLTETMSVSTDGINWVDMEPPETQGCSWGALTYDDGLFVASAAGGPNRIITSPDGFNWTVRSTSGAGVAVGWGAGKWIGLTNNQWRFSADGAVTWSFGGSLPLRGRSTPLYALGSWIAVGENWITRGNASGTLWTGGTAPHPGQWRSVVYAQSMFVAVASGAPGENQIMTSPNGLTWTLRTPTPSFQWTDLVYDAEFERFVAVNSLTDVMWSDDGIDWTDSTSSITSNAQAVAFGDLRPPSPRRRSGLRLGMAMS